MSSPNTYNLTQGGILKKMLLVAVPIMGTQFLQMTYNLTDMFWLGQMEASITAVAASGLAGMFLWLGMAPMMVGRMGAEIGTAQSLGRGESDVAQTYAQTATRMALLLGFLYGLVLLTMADPLITLLQVKEPAVRASTSDYLRIVSIGIPMTYVSAAITGAFNGAGNSRLSFWANAVGLAINMVLDPLLILVLGMGIRGAAAATVLAQATVCLLFILFAKRHRHRPFPRFVLLGKVSMQFGRQIIRWSLPVVVESASFTLLAMVVTSMVSAWYGETAVAVQRVGSQIESLSWLIGGGFSSAVTAFIGQNYGARKWGRIRRGYRIALGALFAWEVLVTFLLVFFGRFFFSLFLREPPQILDMGESFLRILAGCQLFMAMEGACAGAFRGMGRTMPPSVCSISANMIRPFLCWFFAQWMGLDGLWMGVTVSAALRGTLMLIWYTLYEKVIPKHDEVVSPDLERSTI